jgi:hypothetical protein
MNVNFDFRQINLRNDANGATPRLRNCLQTPYVQDLIRRPNSISLEIGDLFIVSSGDAILPITDTIVEVPLEGKQL